MSTLVYIALAIVIGRIIGGVRTAHLPYAAQACMFAAMLGAVTVSLPFGDQGPHLGAVAVIPAVVGALTGALLLRATLTHLISQER